MNRTQPSQVSNYQPSMKNAVLWFERLLSPTLWPKVRSSHQFQPVNNQNVLSQQAGSQKKNSNTRENFLKLSQMNEGIFFYFISLAQSLKKRLEMNQPVIRFQSFLRSALTQRTLSETKQKSYKYPYQVFHTQRFIFRLIPESSLAAGSS